MKKLFFLCIIASVFACSCKVIIGGLINGPEKIEILVHNETNEDVELYYISVVGPYYVDKIPRSESFLVKVTKNTTYYAEGVTTKKDYGSYSYSDSEYPEPVWYIRDITDN